MENKYYILFWPVFVVVWWCSLHVRALLIFTSSAGSCKGLWRSIENLTPLGCKWNGISCLPLALLSPFFYSSSNFLSFSWGPHVLLLSWDSLVLDNHLKQLSNSRALTPLRLNQRELLLESPSWVPSRPSSKAQENCSVHSPQVRLLLLMTNRAYTPNPHF